MAEAEIRLSIVIGALREEHRLGGTLQALQAFLVKHDMLETTEIVVVAADSPDRTVEVAKAAQSSFRYFKVIEPGIAIGKGRDIREGMLAAKGALRLYMDADMATPLKYILTFVSQWEEHGSDVIIGVRAMRTFHSAWSRRFISYIGNICFFIVSGFYVNDTQCGFKAFSAKATELCFPRLTRLAWSFDMELLTIARAHKLEIMQMPVPDWEDKAGGTFSGSSGESWQFLKDLIRILQYRLTGRYK
jgi:dolichyl-phosphate beta-glucosyltransferase